VYDTTQYATTPATPTPPPTPTPYDANGNQTGITDSSPGAAVTSYVMAYDQDDRNTSVTEENASGGTVHTTTLRRDLRPGR